MSDNSFETSLATGPHSLLGKLAGAWEGMTKTFFEPDILADESLWQGTIRPMLNGMFVQHEYSGSLQGKPLTGSALYGYKRSSKQYQCAWVDSFHNGTAMMFCEGRSGDEAFNVTGHYDAPDGSPPWGWRTTITIVTPDEIIITMYNVTPAGEEAKAVETHYHRKGTA